MLWIWYSLLHDKRSPLGRSDYWTIGLFPIHDENTLFVDGKWWRWKPHMSHGKKLVELLSLLLWTFSSTYFKVKITTPFQDSDLNCIKFKRSPSMDFSATKASASQEVFPSCYRHVGIHILVPLTSTDPSAGMCPSQLHFCCCGMQKPRGTKPIKQWWL